MSDGKSDEKGPRPKSIKRSVDGVDVCRYKGEYEGKAFDSVKLERTKYKDDAEKPKVSIKVTKAVAEAILAVLKEQL